MIDQRFKRLFAVALSLIAGVDHIAPKVVLPLVGVVVKHHEANGGVPGVNRSEPGFLGKVGFGY